MPFYLIIDHFMHKNLLKILLKLNLGEKHGLHFTQKIIFSFNRVFPFYVTVHYKWKTIQTGCCHSIKGDQDHLIEVTTKRS